MRKLFLLRTMVVLAAIFAGIPGLERGDSAAFGVTSAEARVYTRKRVNGRWITGRFVSGSKATKPRAQARAASSKVAALAARQEREGPEPNPRPMAAASAPPQAAAPAAPSAPAPSTTTTTDERMLKLQEALQERARMLARAVASEAAAADARGPQATGSVAARPGGDVEPRSLSFDFQSGVKTTVFSNGELVEEKFDVASLRGLAAQAPAGTVQTGGSPQTTSSLQASPAFAPANGRRPLQ